MQPSMKYTLKKGNDRRSEVGRLNKADWSGKHKEKLQAQTVQRPINILVIHLNLQQTVHNDGHWNDYKNLGISL